MEHKDQKLPGHEHGHPAGQKLTEAEELAAAKHDLEEAEREIAHGQADLRKALEEIEAIGQKRREPIEIRVNTKPVEIAEHTATGHEVKEAAIRAGVNIKIDFVLFEDLSNGKQQIVKDDERVKLHPGQCFEAVDNDDHS